MPSDFDSAKWTMEHTDLINALVEELEERGCQIFIERQNSFKVESSRSGVVVGGTPDIIAVHPDRIVTIYDAKTGQESASHIAQVQLYMYLLPKAQGGRWRGGKFEGVVVYADGSEKRISADSMDDAFVSRLSAELGVEEVVTDDSTDYASAVEESGLSRQQCLVHMKRTLGRAKGRLSERIRERYARVLERLSEIVRELPFDGADCCAGQLTGKCHVR